MRVRVLFFGRLKEIVGRAEDEAELSDGSRVEDLFARYGNRYPEFARFRASVVASVNQEVAEWRAPLASGDEVAFLPPVSGGQEAGVAEDVYELPRKPICPEGIRADAKGAEHGAVVVLVGTVGNHSGCPATGSLH